MLPCFGELEAESNSMKKTWVYLLGVLSGVVLTFLVALIINKTRNSAITFFDEPGEIVTVECFGETKPVKSFKIFQTLGEDAGLAMGEDLGSRDLLVLIYSDNGQAVYDNQTIVAPKGMCFRQIGIYKYKSNDKQHRTIPVVMLMEGEFEDDVEESMSFGNQNTDYTFFDEPGEVMSDNSYKVEQVLEDGSAIARGKSEYGSSYYGIKVLIWDEDASFYDGQIIKANDRKCFRQIGIYKHLAYDTYPIVALTDK